jgi:osmotically-inducible protein OsmY
MIAAATPVASADRDIATQIISHLSDTNRANLRRLSVDVRAGEVTLRGCVASFYEKQIAIQACRILPGIDRLIDALEVAPSC